MSTETKSVEPKVLVPLVAGFEEIEMVAPVDLMRRAGIEVTLASVEATPEAMSGIVSRGGIVVKPEVTMAEVDPSSFDLLFIPGGPGVMQMRQEGQIAPLAARLIGQGKPVAAICAAPLLLADAGLLEGRRYTAHDSVAAELPGAEFSERVIEDGPITTSRGPGTALDIGLAIIRRLKGDEAAEEVARQIMA